VISRQAALIAKWLLVGFIHGVMNTDNMSIAGETIDYGPCAFMDVYDLGTVYSTIDTAGRYAYGNQPRIAQWNLARLAETLLPLLADDKDAATKQAQEAIDAFATQRDSLRRGPQPQARPVPASAGRSVPGTGPPRAHGPQRRRFRPDLPPAMRRGCQPTRMWRYAACLPTRTLSTNGPRDGANGLPRRVETQATARPRCAQLTLHLSRATIWWRRRSLQP
jgi:hypothetical protein